MARFDISVEPRGDTYRKLLECCAAWSSTALVVVRDAKYLDDRGRRLLEDLEPYVVSSQAEAEWPGTKLTNDTATVHRFALNQSVLRLLAHGVSRLYEWVEPLPEDLCLLRSDDSPTLVSISHEHDSYLELTDLEAEDLQRSVPLLAFSKRN